MFKNKLTPVRETACLTKIIKAHGLFRESERHFTSKLYLRDVVIVHEYIPQYTAFHLPQSIPSAFRESYK